MANSSLPPRPRNTARIVGIIIGVPLLLFFFSAGFITDRMWFESMGQTQVFDKVILWQAGLFAFAASVGALFAFVNVRYALSNAALMTFRGPIPGVPDPARVEANIRRLALLLAPLMVGLLAGLGQTASWQTWVAFLNRVEVGTKDSTFGLDLSFFMFELPFWRDLQVLVFGIFVMTAIVVAAILYLTKGVEIAQVPGTQRATVLTTSAARKQIGVLGGLILLVYAAGLWLDRYELVTGTGSLITGMTFVDATVNLPAQTIMAGIGVVCAVLCLTIAFRDNFRLPALGLGLFVLAGVLLGGVWPAFVQQVQVKPDEQAKEAPYISLNIEATRKAYGLDKVEYKPYDAVATPDADILETDKETLANIRLMDPYVVARTVEQLQQLKGFYSFTDTMDVSRYTVDGERRGTLLAVRELNLAGIPETQRNWQTTRLIYTHGIGLVAAYDNTSTVDGEPELFESDVPPTGKLGVKEPRIYFGEQTTTYSIVGGSGNIELDYPDDDAPSGQQTTTYTGKGGVALGSTLNKLLFATRFSDVNLLLSEQVTEKSRILFNRTPAERVQALAPWLTLDGDPYPAVVGGRIVWIVDGYTTSNRYPYSQVSEFGASVADSSGRRGANTSLNYIRNSIKATVDAYDGTVTLYLWDESDPIAKTWSAAFPGLLEPKSAMSDELLAQVRYPEDLFKVQRDILRKYHISDANAFFTGENFWIIPDDPTAGTAGLPQPPYYLNLQLPGEEKAAFTLTSTFAPARRPSLSGFMAVNSDPGPDYGKITLLQLPSQTTIPGPVQAQNIFESDAAISSALSLLRRGGSETVQGNLLSLPVGGGILYVQPVYVQSNGVGGYPLLRKVIVGFGQKVFMADTVSAALQQVLGTSGEPSDPGEPNPALTALEALNKALAAADRAYADGQTALQNGDWTAYGAAQRRLSAAIAAAETALARLESGE